MQLSPQAETRFMKDGKKVSDYIKIHSAWED